MLKIPSLKKAIESLAMRDDEEIVNVIAILTTVGLMRISYYQLARKLRDLGPLQVKVLRGEPLTTKEAKQLRDILAYAAYVLSMQMVGGVRLWRSFEKSSNRLQATAKKPSVPPPSSADWQKLNETINDIFRDLAKKSNHPSPPVSS